ncbi:lipase family protein [Gilvimarinus japonicus]|uniref:Fungal lipase-type domain-containing protein n=1 Tax=Gilvimarinus japonicus TaxID=1796469 RepID=A0ABV7HRG0_9GAMM
MISPRPPHHKALASLCAEAYGSHTFVARELEGLHRHMDVKVNEWPEVQVIALRGTEFTDALFNGGWADIVRDLLVWPKRIPGVGVGHAGFITGGADVFQTVVPRLSLDKPIICTGHSLGAAVAQVLALLLKQSGLPVVEYVGFGCPRVFAGKPDWGDVAVTHYQHSADIVPLLLPPGLLYRHPAKACVIGKRHFWPSFKYHDIHHYCREV